MNALLSSLKDSYRRVRYPVLSRICALPEKPVVYTVGARGGLPSTRLEYLSRRDAIRVVGFEPEGEEAASLSSETRMSGLTTFVQCALGDSNGTKTLFVTRMPGASSLYQPDMDVIRQVCHTPEWFDVIKTEQVNVRRLDDLVREQSLPVPDLLHIDAQASEADIVRGAGDLLNKISIITLEAHNYRIYKSQALFNDHCTALFANGFVCCRVDDPNDSPVFKPFAAEFNVSFVNMSLWDKGVTKTDLLMQLARLGERSTQWWTIALHRTLDRFSAIIVK